MEKSTGWRPLHKPTSAGALGGIGRTPFSALAVVHVLSVVGDTLVTMALAGSIFFSISPQAARGKVALYLLLTMAPFAVVAPLLGPALDRSRSGRRTLLILSAAGRAMVCISMANHLDGLWLFPEAFAVLVMSKSHMVTKSALVPTTVTGDAELVAANSRLAMLSVLAGFVAAVPGIAILKIGFLGGPWVLRVAAVAFAAASVASLRVARGKGLARDDARTLTVEEGELRVASVRMSATAMAVLRAAVGCLTFLVAFGFRRRGAPTWWFGVPLATSMVGSFVGAVVAPRARRVIAEERILSGSLLLVAVVGLVAGRLGGLAASAAVAAAIGLSSSAGKLAFDSIVQRDAPDAVRGRTFARFETRFQIAWVLGAALPVVLRIPIGVGLGFIGLACGLAFASYLGGLKVAEHRGRHFTGTADSGT